LCCSRVSSGLPSPVFSQSLFFRSVFCSRPPLLVLLRSFVFSFSFILLLCSFLHCFEHTLTSCFSIPRLPTQPKKYINLHLHTFGQYI
jgi:hypothetical protein